MNCTRCHKAKRIAATYGGRPVCYECIPIGALAAFQREARKAGQSMPSRLRAMATSTRLIEAFRTGDAKGAGEIVQDLSPEDAHQVIGMLAARVSACWDRLGDGCATVAEGSLAEKLAEQDADADVFLVYADAEES